MCRATNVYLQFFKEMIMNFLSKLVFLFALLFSACSQADPSAFEQAQFDALLSEGKPVLVSIHADWCPTCRAQAKIISSLTSDEKYKNVTITRVSFDNQKDVVRNFKAFRQSTLIAYKAGKEVGRSIGDTSPTSIEQLIQKTL